MSEHDSIIESLDVKTKSRSGKIILKMDRTKCIKCKRSEKDLTGSNKNSTKGVSIFSHEQMCIDCEIRFFSVRFHGCGFCKRPIREKFSCSICSDGFINWIKDVIQPIDATSRLLRLSAYRLLNKSIHDLPIDAQRNMKVDDRAFIIRIDDGFYKWPGFYAGITNRFSAQNTRNVSVINIESKSRDLSNRSDDMLTISVDKKKNESDYSNNSDNLDILTETEKLEKKTRIEIVDQSDQRGFFPIWIIPKLTEGYDIKLSDFKLKNLKASLNPFDKILLDILEKNDIHLYSDVQINPETFPSERIKTVNPYDTRVIR
jgi:hypothetical protein